LLQEKIIWSVINIGILNGIIYFNIIGELAYQAFKQYFCLIDILFRQHDIVKIMLRLKTVGTYIVIMSKYNLVYIGSEEEVRVHIIIIIIIIIAVRFPSIASARLSATPPAIHPPSS